MILVLIKNAFGIIKTKQHKKKNYEIQPESPKKLHFCWQYLLTFHRNLHKVQVFPMELMKEYSIGN